MSWHYFQRFWIGLADFVE